MTLAGCWYHRGAFTIGYVTCPGNESARTTHGSVWNNNYIISQKQLNVIKIISLRSKLQQWALLLKFDVEIRCCRLLCGENIHPLVKDGIREFWFRWRMSRWANMLRWRMKKKRIFPAEWPKKTLNGFAYYIIDYNNGYLINRPFNVAKQWNMNDQHYYRWNRIKLIKRRRPRH